MSLTLQQYASYLDTREDLAWPASPAIEPTGLRPSLKKLPDIRAVTWDIHGTLLCILGGQLYLQHPQQMMMDVALDKTIQEFKMWASMSRKPGQPAEYLRQIYSNLLVEQQSVSSGGDKHPEILVDRIWEALLKKLLQKDYKFDAGFMGSLNEYSRKVAYFFHASLQGTVCYPGAAEALADVKNQGLLQGIVANTQCFTLLQLDRGLQKQRAGASLAQVVDDSLQGCSHVLRSRLPGDRPFRHVLTALAAKGIQPHQALHVGARMSMDVIPARRLGMKTALYAGDKGSLEASAPQLNDPHMRPDVLLTELSQIADVVG